MMRVVLEIEIDRTVLNSSLELALSIDENGDVKDDLHKTVLNELNKLGVISKRDLHFADSILFDVDTIRIVKKDKE